MEVKRVCDSRIIIKSSRANLVLANGASISKSSETVTMVFSLVFQLDFSVIVLSGSSGLTLHYYTLQALDTQALASPL